MPDDRERLVRFLRSHLGDVELGRDVDFFAAGLVNSLFALQLVLFVESEFGVEVGDQDLELDNFRSIAALEDFIARKRRHATRV